MKSKCCDADVYAASSRYFAMESDWYECVECERPCDMMDIRQPRMDDNERI